MSFSTQQERRTGMPNRPHAISTAFWTYVIPMAATRAMRIGLVLFVLFIAIITGYIIAIAGRI